MFVHLIWMQGWDYAPERIQKRVETNRSRWREAGLQVRLWDESSIVGIIQDDNLRRWFLSLQTTIAKCDIGRGVVLQKIGGVYADADFDPNPSSIQAFVKEGLQRGIPLFPADPAFHGVNNYLIFSPPAAAFWGKYFDACGKAIVSPAVKDILYAMLRPTWPVLSSHGPVLISRLLSSGLLADSSIPANSLGSHGWLEGEKDSSWYRTAPERLQRKVALLVLVLAIIGAASLFLVGANVCSRCLS